MRVLLVAAANSLTGGGERHVADLADALIGQGHDVAIVAPAGGDFDDVALKRGAVRFKAEIGSGFGLSKVGAVRNAIDAFQPDIVHAHGHRAALFARLADPKAHRRVIVTLHGIHVDKGPLSPVKLLLDRALHRRNAHIITTCVADAKHAYELGIADPASTTVVYNGVRRPNNVVPGAFRAELGIDDDVPLILHVGRLSPPKDHPTLINGFAQYCEMTGDERATLAMICPGDEDERERLAYEYAAPLPSADRIHILPGRARLGTAYADADMFLLTSLWEARPYVLVEAMLHRCAVISTNVGGVAELVTDRETGLLIEPGRPADVAHAIRELVEDVQLRHRLAESAHDYVKDRFTIGTMGKEIEAVYAKVLNRS